MAKRNRQHSCRCAVSERGRTTSRRRSIRRGPQSQLQKLVHLSLTDRQPSGGSALCRTSECFSVGPGLPDSGQLHPEWFPRSSHRLPPALSPFWNWREHLTVDYRIILQGSRIVVPPSLRSSVVKNFHTANQGVVCMKARAHKIVYWPGMTKQLEEFVRQCQEGRTHQRSPLREM